MIKIGINTDNWRHADKSVDYCMDFIAGQGVEYCEFEAVGGTEFFTGLGFAPFIDLNSDPLDLRKKLDGRHQGYLAAQRLFHFKSFANLLITKAARNSSVRGVARQILLGQRDPEDVFSLRGMLKVLLLR